MKRIRHVALVAATILGTTMLYGQASRTWVSGVGDDANPCSRTAPCKTFAGAISKTAAGGEIDALDPAGYGAVTITKGITIDGGGGQVASVLVSGTNGIVVQAGPSDVVILRNLRINGIGTGINGIRFLAGKSLTVENVDIFGFTTNGIDIALNQATAASVHVLSSVVNNVGGVAIRATNAVGPAVLVGIDNTRVALDNIGIEAAQHSRVVVTNSVSSQAANDGLKADDSATNDAQLTVSFVSAQFNKNGITGAAGGNVQVGFSNIAQNTTCGMNNAGAASYFSYGNNRQSGTNSCGSISPAPQQ
jgi:hypothetical protein